MDDQILQALREIANRAGAPTMDYCVSVKVEEQRLSLEWIAHRAAEAIKILTRAQGEAPNAN
jgi:hypothetical protein